METELDRTLNQIRTTLSHRQSPQESPETDSKDSDVCPDCQGTTWILDKKTNSVTPCKCRDKTIMDRRLRFAALPEAFREMDLKTFRTDIYQIPESRDKIKGACQVIKTYLDNFSQMQGRGIGLYMWSNAKGSGKTRMAASIANYLMREKGVQVKFSTSLNIIQEIKNTWDDKEKKSESRLLDALSTAEVLIIDDFGMEQLTAWINSKFFQVLNERYINNRVTILTSNIPFENLEYDDRITDRIGEKMLKIAFPEESIRKIISKNNNAQMLGMLAKQ
ncbi:ATP-binding protein [Diplocloster agilis]|nr:MULTISPECIES: ATP-binding protein [Lachnospiraceae]MCU6736475.1 ATP-binding protein [Suonthocola fibrivorans]SCJ90858.1 Primosomal protein DnaI [uncultured Clostridium sp.]